MDGCIVYGNLKEIHKSMKNMFIDKWFAGIFLQIGNFFRVKFAIFPRKKKYAGDLKKFRDTALQLPGTPHHFSSRIFSMIGDITDHKWT
jgi:hypothetical protein